MVLLIILLVSALMALCILRLGLYSALPLALTLILISVYLVKDGSIIPLSCVIVTGVMAFVLRVTRNLSLVLVLTPFIVVLWMLILSLFADVYLEKIFSQAKEGFLEFESQVLENAEVNDNKEAVEKFFTQLPELSSSLMLGYIALIQMILGLSSLFFARSLQSRLYNPDGWRREFHGLRFTKAGMLILLLGILGCKYFIDYQYGIWLFALPLVIAGLAIVHSYIYVNKFSGYWLFGFYILLLAFAPLIMSILILLVIIDYWICLRRRLESVK